MNLVIQNFSLVLMQHKEWVFLVAFGGTKKEPSNQVGEVHLSISANFNVFTHAFNLSTIKLNLGALFIFILFLMVVAG